MVNCMRLELGPRKIQVIEKAAFVSLPKAWIESCHLKKGDQVRIAIREDGTLEISSHKEVEKVE